MKCHAARSIYSSILKAIHPPPGYREGIILNAVLNAWIRCYRFVFIIVWDFEQIQGFGGDYAPFCRTARRDDHNSALACWDGR